jgi:hypothetical protein
VASGTLFEWRIVARTIGRFSFEVIKAEVLQYTFIIKDDSGLEIFLAVF